MKIRTGTPKKKKDIIPVNGEVGLGVRLGVGYLF